MPIRLKENTLPGFFVIVFFLLSLYKLQDNPAPWFDEIAHLNTASHIAREGRMWCDFYTAKFNGRLFNSMPLPWLILGAYYKAFNPDMFLARLLYLFLGAITLISSYLLVLRLFNRKVALVALAFLAANHLFFLNARQVMPQVFTAMFGIIALLLFYIAIEKESKTAFALCGLSAGLAYLSHPTGLGVAVIVAILFFYKKVPLKYFFLYIAILALTLLPYAIYVTVNLQEYIRQMHIGLEEMYRIQPLPFRILDEIPVRYFFLPNLRDAFENEIVNGAVVNKYADKIKWLAANLNSKVYIAQVSGTICLIIALAYLLFKRRKSRSEKDIVLITFAYMVFLSILPNKFNAYLYVISPYLTTCLVVSLFSLFKNSGRVKSYLKKATAIILALLFLSSNLIFIYKTLTSPKIKSYDSFIKNVTDVVPKGSVIAGPVYFWPGLQRDYHFISANQIIYETDEVLRDRKNGMRFEDLSRDEQDVVVREALARHDIRYVLLTCHRWEYLTEAFTLAVDFSRGLRHYLFYNGTKRLDVLKKIYYEARPEAGSFEEEAYTTPAGVGYNNVSEEYQNSLKIYEL